LCYTLCNKTSKESFPHSSKENDQTSRRLHGWKKKIKPFISIELDLKKGTRLSLFPLKKVSGVKSKGLKYDIKNIQFSPGNRIGTSNEVSGTNVSIELDGPGMIIILPKKCFKDIIIKFNQKFLR